MVRRKKRKSHGHPRKGKIVYEISRKSGAADCYSRRKESNGKAWEKSFTKRGGENTEILLDHLTLDHGREKGEKMERTGERWEEKTGLLQGRG